MPGFQVPQTCHKDFSHLWLVFLNFYLIQVFLLCRKPFHFFLLIFKNGLVSPYILIGKFSSFTISVATFSHNFIPLVIIKLLIYFVSIFFFSLFFLHLFILHFSFPFVFVISALSFYLINGFLLFPNTYN